jgi:hypothetical protein
VPAEIEEFIVPLKSKKRELTPPLELRIAGSMKKI